MRNVFPPSGQSYSLASALRCVVRLARHCGSGSARFFLPASRRNHAVGRRGAETRIYWGHFAACVAHGTECACAGGTNYPRRLHHRGRRGAVRPRILCGLRQVLRRVRAFTFAGSRAAVYLRGVCRWAGRFTDPFETGAARRGMHALPAWLTHHKRAWPGSCLDRARCWRFSSCTAPC